MHVKVSAVITFVTSTGAGNCNVAFFVYGGGYGTPTQFTPTVTQFAYYLGSAVSVSALGSLSINPSTAYNIYLEISGAGGSGTCTANTNSALMLVEETPY